MDPDVMVLILIGLFMLASYLAYGAGYATGRLRSQKAIGEFMDDLLREMPKQCAIDFIEAAERLKTRYRRELHGGAVDD